MRIETLRMKPELTKLLPFHTEEPSQIITIIQEIGNCRSKHFTSMASWGFYYHYKVYGGGKVIAFYVTHRYKLRRDRETAAPLV